MEHFDVLIVGAGLSGIGAGARLRMEWPDKNFAHAWADDDPESGPFPGSEPEARAVMDYLLARRNIALAFVFGPANNLLATPRGVGGSLEIGQIRVTPSAAMAQSRRPSASSA